MLNANFLIKFHFKKMLNLQLDLSETVSEYLGIYKKYSALLFYSIFYRFS